MMIDIPLVWLLVTVISMAVSAILVILARRRKDLDKLGVDHRVELTELANTRKEVIEQLREEMTAMNERHREEISDLNRQIAELRGQYDAMRRFQVNEIIDSVTRGVLAGLAALDPDDL